MRHRILLNVVETVHHVVSQCIDCSITLLFVLCYTVKMWWKHFITWFLSVTTTLADYYCVLLYSFVKCGRNISSRGFCNSPAP